MVNRSITFIPVLRLISYGTSYNLQVTTTLPFTAFTFAYKLIYLLMHSISLIVRYFRFLSGAGEEIVTFCPSYLSFFVVICAAFYSYIWLLFFTLFLCV